MSWVTIIVGSVGDIDRRSFMRSTQHLRWQDHSRSQRTLLCNGAWHGFERRAKLRKHACFSQVRQSWSTGSHTVARSMAQRRISRL